MCLRLPHYSSSASHVFKISTNPEGLNGTHAEVVNSNLQHLNKVLVDLSVEKCFAYKGCIRVFLPSLFVCYVSAEHFEHDER